MNKNHEKIVDILKTDQMGLTAKQISDIGNFSGRTAVSRFLRELKEKEVVTFWRSGKNIYYALSAKKVVYHNKLHAAGLNESDVWSDIARKDVLLDNTSENARGILYFAFTEMLNNAIEHSKTEYINVYVAIEGEKLYFIIRDFGIGVFRNIMRIKHFPDEVYAIQELMKGKTTTAPKFHSGEGIYWTSKIADIFSLNSYGYSLVINNRINDYTIQTRETISPEGTEVYFEIEATTSRSLEKFFNKHMSEENDYAFSTTEIQIQLYQDGEVWISRSQARRILSGLERYKKIILNFSNVGLVGQAFCDEIFRVFRIAHPDIILEPINMNNSVNLMVQRALKDPTGM